MNVERSRPLPPRKTEKLFRGDLRDHENNACLTRDEYRYSEGYRRGAQVLVRAAIEAAGGHGLLVYPIIFLYRHHIELVLKRIIRQSPYLIERPLTTAEEKNLDGHRLDLLWRDFKPMAGAISQAAGWNELRPEDVEGIEHYIDQITEIDPNSYSLRYAHSKEGVPLLPDDFTHINLRHFGELMERMADYLNGLEAAMLYLGGLKEDFEQG